MYNENRPIPFMQHPITVVLKAIKQKTLREIHCLECGWPMGAISDKVLMTFDGETPAEHFLPDQIGLISIRCKRCKQNYKIEIAK